MITRRAFLTGLTATTALVAVPGAAVATLRHEDLMKLLARKMEETSQKLRADLERELYGDTNNNPKGGLASLIEESPYQWKTVAEGFSVDVTAA